MRLVAIDASPLRGGAVTQGVEAAAAAAEAAGSQRAVVLRRRLCDEWSRGQLDAAHGRTAEAERALDDLADAIVCADGVILGISGAGVGAPVRMLAHRLEAYFAGRCLERGHHGMPTRLRPGPRLALVVGVRGSRLGRSRAAVAPQALLLRRTFASAGVGCGGVVAVPVGTATPFARRGALTDAASLGGHLASALRETQGDSALSHPVLVERLAL